jgi:hypothetical protein
LNCPRQLREFKALDHWAMVRPSMLVLTCVVLLVALVAEWVGLISVQFLHPWPTHETRQSIASAR